MIQPVIIWQKPKHEKREGGRAGVTNVDCCAEKDSRDSELRSPAMDNSSVRGTRTKKGYPTRITFPFSHYPFLHHHLPQ